MVWYSLLPSYLSGLETWIVRIAVRSYFSVGDQDIRLGLFNRLCQFYDSKLMCSTLQMFCAILITAPWLLAFSIDLLLYLYRQLRHWTPFWGGRAQGSRLPSLPSLMKARQRALSLAGIMKGSDTKCAHEDTARQRHKRPVREHSLDSDDVYSYSSSPGIHMTNST